MSLVVSECSSDDGLADPAASENGNEVIRAERLRKLQKRVSIRAMMSSSLPMQSSDDDSDDPHGPPRNATPATDLESRMEDRRHTRCDEMSKFEVASGSTGSSLLEAAPRDELEQLKQTLKNLVVGEEKCSFKAALRRRHSDLEHEQAAHRTLPKTRSSVSPKLNPRSFSPNASFQKYRSPNLTASNPMEIASISSNLHGSRAVLSALKALQDKIRRLEEERESLLQQQSDLRVHIRKQEAELASAEKKRAYDVSQAKESARSAYEALRLEREELRLQLAKYEERKKSLDNELKHFQALATTYHTKSDDLENQVQLVETQYKRVISDMEMQKKKHEDEMKLMSAQIVELKLSRQEAIERADEQELLVRQERTHVEELNLKIEKCEQTIGCVSQLNEKLVQKLWEAIENTKQQRKQQRQQEKEEATAKAKIPVADRSTAASRAAKSTSAKALTSQVCSSTVRSAPTTSRPLAGGNSTAQPPKPSTVSLRKRKTVATTKKGKKSKNNLERLREANLGKDIPFLVGQSASPSFSLIANIQDTIRQCDSSFAVPAVGNSEFAHAPSDDQERGNQKTLVAAARASSKWPPPVISTSKTGRLSSGEVSTSRMPKILEELGLALESAEKEFARLNGRYKDTVSNMETGASNGQSAQLCDALGPLLDELEGKSKQVQLLKQAYNHACEQDRLFQESSRKPIRVHSPEAIRRKTASLRLLNEYRQMERDAKCTSINADISPPTLASANQTIHS